MTTKPIPKWVTDQLIRDGQITPDRITKHARPRRCPTCGLYTLTGLDDLLPSEVHVDPQPTTTAGECFALLTGRASYGMDRHELYGRYASRIAHHRADDWPVYISHQCESPPLPINPKFRPTPLIRTTGEPPY